MDKGLLDRKPHIAVIGAGLAGLRCADVLIQNGARVSVFEARDRVGGRVGIISYSVEKEKIKKRNCHEIIRTVFFFFFFLVKIPY